MGFTMLNNGVQCMFSYIYIYGYVCHVLQYHVVPRFVPGCTAGSLQIPLPQLGSGNHVQRQLLPWFRFQPEDAAVLRGSSGCPMSSQSNSWTFWLLHVQLDKPVVYVASALMLVFLGWEGHVLATWDEVRYIKKQSQESCKEMANWMDCKHHEKSSAKQILTSRFL